MIGQQPLPGSVLTDGSCTCGEGDLFHISHPNTDWRVCLEHAEKLGLGTRSYTLVKV